MNIIKIIKKIIKKLLKIAIILLILIGIGFGAYTFWIVKQSEEKLTFFLEDQPKNFKGIEWKPVRSVWETLATNIGRLPEYGDAQEGYDSEGRLVFRHVQLNEEIPVVAYYFSSSKDFNILSIHWVIDCEPMKIFNQTDKETGRSNLACWKNGKSVNTGRMVNSYSGQLFQQYKWVEMSGFSYWPSRWYFDWDKMARNKNLKGSILD